MSSDTILTADTTRIYPIVRTSSWIPPTESRVTRAGPCCPHPREKPQALRHAWPSQVTAARQPSDRGRSRWWTHGLRTRCIQSRAAAGRAFSREKLSGAQDGSLCPPGRATMSGQGPDHRYHESGRRERAQRGSAFGCQLRPGHPPGYILLAAMHVRRPANGRPLTRRSSRIMVTVR